jgi:hypothetical protein
MRGSHGQDHSDVRFDHVCQVTDVPDSGGAHLNHEITRIGARPEDGERNSDFAVVGTLRRHGVSLRGQDSGEEVLGGGFSCRAGDSHYRQFAALAGAGGLRMRRTASAARVPIASTASGTTTEG